MPFANCRSCGRLFHIFEPLLPESPEKLGLHLSLGDAVYELCPECLKMLYDEQHDPKDDAESRRISHETGSE